MQSSNLEALANLKNFDDMISIADQTIPKKRTCSPTTEGTAEVSFDILERFPVLLCQYVFQHLGSKELLEMSLVNREWSKLAGETLSLEFPLKMSFKTRDIFMNSERRYRNINADVSLKNLDFFLGFLACRAGLWKSVHIEFCDEMSHDVRTKVLKIVEPSVEKLSVTDWYHAGNCDLFDDQPENSSSVALCWTFPRLKVLECNDCCYNIFRHFDCVTSLISFQFGKPMREAHKATSDIKSLLVNNRNLKEIIVDMQSDTFEYSSNFKFKLQKISIRDDNGKNSARNFFSFLKTQAQTLESLALHDSFDRALLDLVLSMSRLKSLEFHHPMDETIDEVSVNTTITSVEFEYGFTDRQRIAHQNLFKSLPNLKRFKCHTIGHEIFLFLAQNVPGLESMECYHFNVPVDLDQNIFPKIKEFKTEWFSSKEPTGDTNFAKQIRKFLNEKVSNFNSDATDSEIAYSSGSESSFSFHSETSGDKIGFR